MHAILSSIHPIIGDSKYSKYKGNATRSRSSPGIFIGSILPLRDEKKYRNPLKSPDGADLALDVIVSMAVI